MSSKAKERLTSQIFFWENFFSKPRDNNSIREILKKNVLFQDLTPEELRYLERIIHVRHYEPGEYIFHQNERALGMYIITSGKINIMVQVSDSDKSTLTETMITSLTEGAFFGEHSLIDVDSKRTASTIACEPTTLIAFMKPDLMDIVQRRPIMGLKITMQLARVLSMRLRKTTEKLSELKVRDADEEEKD